MTAALATTLVSAARADEGVHGVHLSVRDGAACTDDTRFFASLARRSAKIVLDPSSADSVAIRIDPAADGIRGELVVVRDGARSARSLEGGTCDEIVRGLSLVAALAFDPDAALEPEAPSLPPPSLPSRPPRDRAAAPLTGTPSASPSAPLRFGLGGGAALLALGGDDPTIGASGFVELQKDRRGLAPQARLGFSHATAIATTPSDGVGPISARLTLVTGQASLCPLRADLGAGTHLRPCASLEAGALTGTPDAPITGAARTRAWVALGLSVRFDWEIERFFFLEAEVGGRAPLVRDELGAEPRTVVYRAPALIPVGALSAGVRFP